MFSSLGCKKNEISSFNFQFDKQSIFEINPTILELRFWEKMFKNC